MTDRKIQRFGWKPDLPDARDKYMSISYWRRFKLVLPSSVDLRPDMPAIYDQGELGSCTANAIAAAVQYEHRRQKLPDFMPSRLFIYYNERLMEGTINEDAGAEIRDGVKSLVKWGVCDEIQWPYVIGALKTKPLPASYAQAKFDIIKSYSRTYQTADYLRATLATGLPIVFGFTVYESFESDAVAKTGVVPMPGPKEAVIGGHAVLIVGYLEDRFICRNSWGPDWGDKGYFTMPSEYVTNPDLASDFWVISAVQ